MKKNHEDFKGYNLNSETLGIILRGDYGSIIMPGVRKAGSVELRCDVAEGSVDLSRLKTSKNLVLPGRIGEDLYLSSFKPYAGQGFKPPEQISGDAYLSRHFAESGKGREMVLEIGRKTEGSVYIGRGRIQAAKAKKQLDELVNELAEGRNSDQGQVYAVTSLPKGSAVSVPRNILHWTMYGAGGIAAAAGTLGLASVAAPDLISAYDLDLKDPASSYAAVVLGGVAAAALGGIVHLTNKGSSAPEKAGK